MFAVNMVLGIWILLCVFSTYNTYINPPQTLEQEEESKEELNKLVGEESANNLVKLIYSVATLFDYAMLVTVLCFYRTELITIAISICFLISSIYSIYIFRVKHIPDLLEVIRQCSFCFVAVMTAVYILF
jgi:1,4-dihydroxy-2-naphthoate octaprenyltransferase